ncbi:MAG: hypothetical protein U0V18_01925 [Anaerolineales bacterium]
MKLKAPILFAITTLALAALACQALSGGNSENPSPVATEGSTESTTNTTTDTSQPALAPAVSAKGPGIVCAGLRAGGISCLNENGWQTYTDENSDLASSFIDAGTTCPDGRIAISHYDGVSLFDGNTWENINSSNNYSSVNGIACDLNGNIWVAHYQGVSRYSNNAWNTYPSSELATGEFANDLVYGVAATSTGMVWVATSRSVASFDGTTWTVYQQGSGFTEDVFFNAITVDSLDRPWAGVSDGAYVFENNVWKKVKRDGYDTPQAMSIDARGQIWLATLSNGVLAFNGNSWSGYNTDSKHLSSDHANGIAADTLGRVWVGTTYGLSVFDGSNWQTLRMDNSDLGDNYVKFVVATKDGPTLPELADKAKSGLTGSLNDTSNTPMPNMRVEICVEPLTSSFDGETPCSDQPFFLRTQTDANGVFTFTDVPAGYYVIVAETGDGSWAQLTDEFGIGSERTLLPAGQPYDIGPLTLQ